MAKLTINTGTSNDAGNGDSLRTAFTKINDNFTELYTLTGNNSTAAIKDIKGSVFGDDSTTLVDSVASSINLEGTVKGNIIPDTTEVYDIGSSSKRFKDLYLKGNTITLGSQTISSTASGISTSGTLTATAVTTTSPSTLSGTFTGDVTGSVFADDSTPIIDGVDGIVVGNVRNGLTTTGALRTNQISNDLLAPMLMTATDSGLVITNTNLSNPGAIAGSNLEIHSQNNAVEITGNSYVSIISGSAGGPYADMDIYGDVLTLNGGQVYYNHTNQTFSGTVDFSSATVTGINPGVDLTAFSVGAEASASGDGGIAYDNSTGVFTYTPPDLSGYQTTLVSGTDIKTINGTSLLGSGDVTISASGADLSAVDENYAPDTDNAYDLGIATGNFLRTGYFKTSVVIGTGQYSNATLTYNADGELQSSSSINTFGLTSSSYMTINPGFGGLIFWQERGGNVAGLSGVNGNDEMVWFGSNYSTNGPTYQLDSDQANLQIGGEVTKTISGVTLGATTSLNFSDPYYANPNTTVTITSVVGTTELNNQTYFINSSNELFTDAALTTPLDSSAFTAYVSGGTAVVAPRATASLPVLHSAPTTPKSGMMAVADGTNWNPTGTGTETMVVYLGGAWRTIANA